MHLTHDSVTSYLGALGERSGVVVAAGTGVVTIGVGNDTVARIDGWGHIMGDAGSGYWIGQQALQAAMRAYDGRGEATALSAVVYNLLGPLDAAYMKLQADPNFVATVASMARHVAELAPVDLIAATISAQAAKHLADSVLTAVRRISTTTTATTDLAICTLGGVFENQELLAQFSLLLNLAGVLHQVVPSQGTGLDGAMLLADLAQSHPLRQLIDTARNHQ